MRRAPPLLALLAVLPLTSNAAEITRIATSFENTDPFGMFIDVSYVRDQHKAEILREAHQDGAVEEVSELRYLMVDNQLDFDLRIGLWQDVELKFSVPLVFSQNRNWEFAAGNDAASSTIINNCLQPDGYLLDPNCLATGAGSQPIFDVPNASYRGGLGNMHFGLAAALFNERKDPSKPTWLVSFDYEAPTAELRDPTQVTSPTSRGKIGDRIHRYTFATAFSKRLGIADPYFRIHYTLPARGPGWYSNCDHQSATNMSIPSNCGTGIWTRSETGIKPPHSGGVTFGNEFNLYDNLEKQQRVVLDLRAIANYVGPGRTYNPLSDVLGKLLYTADSMDMGGQLGLTAQGSDFLTFHASTQVLYTTEHTLTEEEIGKDVTGDGSVQLNNVEELNPNFDYRYDMVSRRFRLSDGFKWRLDVRATFTF